MKKFCALILVVMALAAPAFAHGHHHHEGRWCHEEAARRNITLITEAQAKKIAEDRINERGVTFKDIDLDNEADDYPSSSGFRPVYSLECVCPSGEYDVEVDAITGEILKFKLDD